MAPSKLSSKPRAHAPTSTRIVFAHRGLNRLAPENTFPAFELAADSGGNWLEMDVITISDGTPIVIHDSTLDRTTNRAGSVYPLKTSDLDSIDAGSWFAPRFEGTRLPKFADFVRFLNDRKMNCNVELKTHALGRSASAEMVDAVISDLKALDEEREIIISSFSPLLLAMFHERAPEYAIGVLTDEHTLGEDWLSVLEMTGASYLHPEESGLTEEMVARIVDAGYGVNPWTVDVADRANQLFNWGATGIFTDVADQLQHLSA